MKQLECKCQATYCAYLFKPTDLPVGLHTTIKVPDSRCQYSSPAGHDVTVLSQVRLADAAVVDLMLSITQLQITKFLIWSLLS